MIESCKGCDYYRHVSGVCCTVPPIDECTHPDAERLGLMDLEECWAKSTPLPELTCGGKKLKAARGEASA